MSAQVKGKDEEPEPQCQLGPALQVRRYLLEMLSVTLLRSHATVSLADWDRLQLYHANQSVILVSSAISFSKEDGKDELIATVIAFHSARRTGFWGRGSQGTPDSFRVPNSHRKPRWKETSYGSQKTKRTSRLWSRVISHDLAMVGRSTVVLKATSDEWKDVPLAVKINWPTS